jgi:hypothetical protein
LTFFVVPLFDMDPETRTVRAFLVAMQPVRDALSDLVRRLYERPQVKLVTTYNPRMFASTDLGVSAVLLNGAVVDFWIDLSFEETAWRIEYSVQRSDPDEDGSHTELDFPPETIRSVSDMPTTLLVAIGRLQKASATDAFYR